jgi:hypothetical protein
MFGWLSSFLTSSDEERKARETLVRTKTHLDATKSELEEVNRRLEVSDFHDPNLKHKHILLTSVSAVSTIPDFVLLTADLINWVIVVREHDR